MNESTRHRLSLALLVVALLLIVSAWYYAFQVAPTERTMGTIQRIFYLHLPAAFLSFLAFFVVFVGSVAYLWTRRIGWDWAAASAAEVGVVFCAAVLISGPLWAKPVWGIWWTWDARLTTTLILFLIYVAYLMLRLGARPADVVGRAVGLRRPADLCELAVLPTLPDGGDARRADRARPPRPRLGEKHGNRPETSFLCLRHRLGPAARLRLQPGPAAEAARGRAGNAEEGPGPKEQLTRCKWDSSAWDAWARPWWRACAGTSIRWWPTTATPRR